MISTRFLMGFGYLLRARDIVINLLLCFDWIMGLFWIFLEENARLNLELVNSFFFHYSIFSFLESHDRAVLIALKPIGVFLLFRFFSLTYFVKTIDNFTLVDRKFWTIFFYFIWNIWNTVYRGYRGANVVKFLHHSF